MDFLQYIKKIHGFSNFSRRNRILLIAHFLREYGGIFEFTAKNLSDQCKNVVKAPSNINAILLELSKGRNAALLKSNRSGFFSLSVAGVEEAQGFLYDSIGEPAFLDKFIGDVTNHLNKSTIKVGEENKRKFLNEAISCLKVNANRATIIMMWACAIDHLYDYILKYKLVEFNDALKAISQKVVIACKDDFLEIKEKNFIELLRTSGIISSSVRKIIDEKLGIRNSAAHPSNIVIHKTKVINFIEDLIDNIILKYEI
jgi:hypothetical protein